MILPQQSISSAIINPSMPKKHNLTTTLTDVHAVRNKHANAVWEVEKLWQKVPARNYTLRKRLVKSAVSLAQIAQEIEAISRKQRV